MVDATKMVENKPAHLLKYTINIVESATYVNSLKIFHSTQNYKKMFML